MNPGPLVTLHGIDVWLCKDFANHVCLTSHQGLYLCAIGNSVKLHGFITNEDDPFFVRKPCDKPYWANKIGITLAQFDEILDFVTAHYNLSR